MVGSALSALGDLEHTGGDGNLEDSSDAAAVEAVHDALRDEESLDFVGIIFEFRIFGAGVAIGGETKDSSDNEAGKLGAATKAVTDGAAADQRPPEGADHEADSEDGKAEVQDGIEREEGGPFGVRGSKNIVAASIVLGHLKA